LSYGINLLSTPQTLGLKLALQIAKSGSGLTVVESNGSCTETNETIAKKYSPRINGQTSMEVIGVSLAIAPLAIVKATKHGTIPTPFSICTFPYGSPKSRMSLTGDVSGNFQVGLGPGRVTVYAVLLRWCLSTLCNTRSN
jgi:hypothetical protein